MVRMVRPLALVLLQFAAALLCQANAKEFTGLDRVTEIQWAPAAPGSRRMYNFNVVMPKYTVNDFTDALQQQLLDVLHESISGAIFRVANTTEEAAGVSVQTTVQFTANAITDWSETARELYLTLRTGTLQSLLPPSIWGDSIVMQVTMPYVSTVAEFLNTYDLSTLVYGLQANLLLESRTFDWLTFERAQALLEPFMNSADVVVSNLWKHRFVPTAGPEAVIATIQVASYSKAALQGIQDHLQSESSSVWPAPIWGPTQLLPQLQIVPLGGQVASPFPQSPESPPPSPRFPPPSPRFPPPSPRFPPPSPRFPPPPPRFPPPSPRSPPLPPPPPPPALVSPTDPAQLLYQGSEFAAATDTAVPVVGQQTRRRGLLQAQPLVVGTVNPGNYPYKGSSYVIDAEGLLVTSLYVQYRLVGFSIDEFLNDFTVRVDGTTYDTETSPGPLPPPLPPASPDSPSTTSPDAPASPSPDAPASPSPDAPASPPPDAPASPRPDAPASPPPDAPSSPPASPSMWGWGANRDGQLGLGSLGTVEDGPVAAATGMVWVAAGAYFACGYDESAALYCWGENDKGQCGAGTAGAALPSPQKIGESVGGVTAGRWHACYFDAPAARGFCWGDNEDGQLGTGSTSPALAPTAIAGSRAWEQLSAGYSHTCGIDAAGTTLLCWGDGAFGALGLGSEESFSSPQVVSENVPWGAVAAGLQSTCAVNQAGVVCFGSNEFGLLGNGGDVRYSNVPVPVFGSSGATGVDTWEGTACMLGSAGEVKCWGRGDAGQMGDGSARAVNLLPVSVAGGIDSWASVGVGGPHVCGAARSDGQVYCWGSNAVGQLGIGTPDPEQSWVPSGVQVRAQAAVAARQENTFAYGVFAGERS